MHDSNLQKLLIEIFKVKLKLAPEIMNEVFDTIVCLYSLRNELRFKSRNIRTVRYVIEIVAFVGSRIWSYIPSELKESMSLNEFRSKKTNLEARKQPVQTLLAKNGLPTSY